jgi:hypothetical protein
MKNKFTYNYGTQNVGIPGSDKLVATLTHVQQEGFSQSYYHLHWNNYRQGMTVNEHLAVMYNGSVGFKSIDDAFEYLNQIL